MYIVILLGLLCGIMDGFNKMHSTKKNKVPYKEPKNIIDFVING